MNSKLLLISLLLMIAQASQAKNLDHFFIKGNKKLDKKVFFKQPSFKVISITLEKGEILPQHTVGFDALLICLSGKAKYFKADKEITMQQHDYHPIKKGVSHKIIAEEDTQFILIRP